MANEKQLIYVNALVKDLELLAKHEDSIRQSVILGVVHTVKAQPTVDAVEEVHASWHDVYLLTPWIATGICSHCNLKSYINPDFPWAKHCPNCGAKMDGGKET